MPRELNPSIFTPLNVVDTCSVWNILSSITLYKAATAHNCCFCCTKFVEYECLIKKRKEVKAKDLELQKILRDEVSKKNQFKSYELSIEDLQDLQVLQNRKKLGKGELTSIVYAKKINQAFLTDDKKARKLGESISITVQTTPHLFGWLFYNDRLVDSDKDKIIQEHEDLQSDSDTLLTKHINDMYVRTCQYKLNRGSHPE